jgi:SAM-dependent methyltransferase
MIGVMKGAVAIPDGRAGTSLPGEDWRRRLLRCPACQGELRVGSGDSAAIPAPRIASWSGGEDARAGAAPGRGLEGGPPAASSGGLVCQNADCSLSFPVVDQVPVLIHDAASLFSREDFVSHRNTTFNLTRSGLKQWVDARLPKLGRNLKAEDNHDCLGRLLLEQSSKPLVLVVGGSIPGRGFHRLMARPELRLVETDVSFGPRTRIICDCHNLPFADQTFDGVVIQAVLQYVVDVPRCVRELERVLKPGGLVYAEAAFMQQVVHGRYDFTRFTHLGLRRHFRRFQEIRSGPTAGPGMGLAWAWHFFLLSFVSGKTARSVVHVIARLTAFWLKYLDPLLIGRPGTFDAAPGYFFLGRLAGRTLTDRELVQQYRGAQ